MIASFPAEKLAQVYLYTLPLSPNQEQHMGWLFQPGSTRRELIKERTHGWERASNEMLVKSSCLAHCFRGGRFSGVLWSVWERTFTKGWGYKDMEESMHPYFYSCPLGYLEMVPIEQFGGNEEWRVGVRSYQQRAKDKRIARRLQKADHRR